MIVLRVKKIIFQERTTHEKKEKHDNLDGYEKEQLTKY